MKLTPQQINEKIAELKGNDFDFGATIGAKDGYWDSDRVENWATDDGQACKLLDEMPEFYQLIKLDPNPECWRVDWISGAQCYGPMCKTRPLAICAAWLAMHGVEVEIAEVDDDLDT